MSNEQDANDHEPDPTHDQNPPLMIPTRGGRRAPDDPAAPGVKPSSTLTWLKELMAGKSKNDESEPELKPSKSDISNAGPSQFLNATSRLETGQHERSEASLINPLEQSPDSPALAESVIEPVEYRFPDDLPTDQLPQNRLPLPASDTGLSASSAVPSLPSQLSVATSHGISLPSQASIATSHGISLPTRPSMATSQGTSHGISEDQSEQDPDETVSLSYFANPLRSYRSDADLAEEDSVDIMFEDFAYEAGSEINSPDDIDSPVYTASRDSLSILGEEIAASRRARAEAGDEERTARFREAQEAAESVQESPGPLLPTVRRAINFNLPPTAEPEAEPEKWTKGLTRGLSKLFGREPRSTPDPELGRIPWALKGKGRADPPKVARPKPPRPPPPIANPLNMIKRLSRPVTRDSSIDLSSDHGSPIVAGITRKLSFRRPATAPTALEMSPEIKRDPFAKDLVPLAEESVLPTTMPKRSSVYARLASRSMKRRPSTVMQGPSLSKVERVLGTNLDTYKSSTQSYPDLLMPQPRPHPTARPTSFAGLPAISHPFARQPETIPQPKQAGNAPRAKQSENAIGKWFRGITRPQTAEGFHLPYKSASTSVATYGSTRKASVASYESVAERLERMVSRASSQLEPGSPPHTGPSIAPTLYPDGIDPIADPELYALVREWQLHRRHEDERRLHSSQGSIVNAFPLPPSPPPRQSSLPTPGLLSPHWTPTTPISPPLVVPEGAVLPPLFTYAPLRPGEPITDVSLVLAQTPNPSGAEPATDRHIPPRETTALDGFDALSAIHPSPAPATAPNALGLSNSSSRVSFAPSPPRHSHIDLKDFLLSSPSQILRTTSAGELHRPDDGPLIPDFPATFDDIDHLLVYETDVWRRVDDHWVTREMDILWQSPHPQYGWKQYHLVLTSAQRRLIDEENPADIESEVCIHLFAITDEATPWRSHAAKFNGRFAPLYTPEITRRIVYPSTTISTFQPYTVRGWKEVDDQLDITRIDENGEHPWFLELRNLDTHVEFAHYLNTERDCLIAGRHGCGTAFRHRITHTPHTRTQRSRILAEEIATASARWGTRHLALEDATPPPSPIRPAPRLPVGTPSKSILKKRASTGTLNRKVSPIGPHSSFQGYIHELDAWKKANDLERMFRDERAATLMAERTRSRHSTTGPSTAGAAGPSSTGTAGTTGTARVGAAGPSTTRTHGIEITPALTDVSLPSEGDIVSPPNVLTVLPRPTTRAKANAPSHPPAPPSRCSASPDSPGRMRSAQYDETEEETSAKMAECYDWLEDMINPDYAYADDPPPASPPPISCPESPTVPTDKPTLPSHFAHLLTTTNKSPPRYGTNWPSETCIVYGNTGPVRPIPTLENACKTYPAPPEPRFEDGFVIPAGIHMSDANEDWKHLIPVVPPPVRVIKLMSEATAKTMYEQVKRKVDQEMEEARARGTVPDWFADLAREDARKMAGFVDEEVAVGNMSGDLGGMGGSVGDRDMSAAGTGKENAGSEGGKDKSGTGARKRLTAKQKGKGKENVPSQPVPQTLWEDNNPFANFYATHPSSSPPPLSGQVIPPADVHFMGYNPPPPVPPPVEKTQKERMMVLLGNLQRVIAQETARKPPTTAPPPPSAPPLPPLTAAVARQLLMNAQAYSLHPAPDPGVLEYHRRQLGLVHMVMMEHVRMTGMAQVARIQQARAAQGQARAVEEQGRGTEIEDNGKDEEVLDKGKEKEITDKGKGKGKENEVPKKAESEKEYRLRMIRESLYGLVKNSEEIKRIRVVTPVLVHAPAPAPAPGSTPVERDIPPVPLSTDTPNASLVPTDQQGQHAIPEPVEQPSLADIAPADAPTSPNAIPVVPSESPSTRFLISQSTSTPYLVKQAQSGFTNQTPDLITPVQSLTAIVPDSDSTPSRPSRSKQKRDDEDMTVPKRGKSTLRELVPKADEGLVRSKRIEQARAKREADACMEQ